MIRALLLSLSLALPTVAADPPAAPKGGPQAAAVTVPGMEAVPQTTSASGPVVCPLGRFVVFLPAADEKLSYFPADAVKRYPLGTVVINHTHWKESAPRDHTFPAAKGHIGLLFPTKDVTVQVWRNGENGPELVQSIDVKVPDATPPPGVDPPRIDPPVTPPAGGLYFMVIRADGPADPAFVRVMADPAWAELRAKGHSVKDFTLADSKRLGTELRPGATLPTVLTLSISADGKKSTIVRDVTDLPTTSDGIRRLPEGVTR